MNVRALCLWIAISGLFSTGCSKSDEVYYHGKVKNTLAQSVHLDFYSTFNDYSNSTNIKRSIVIPAHGEYEIPSEFEGGAKYYLDWYSEDFLNTNWGSDASFNIPNISPEMDPALTIPQRFTYTRRIFINGNQPSVTWKAIDAKAGSSSVWQTLTSNEKYREIVIRKNLTGTYSYKDNSGVIQKMDFVFNTNIGSSLSTNIFLTFNGSVSGNNTLSAAIGNGSSVVLDTIMTQSFFPPENSNFYSYYFARQ